MGHEQAADKINLAILTTLVHLALKELRQSLGVLVSFGVVVDIVSQFSKAFMKGRKVRFVVDRRLIHVVEDLLEYEGMLE